MRLESWIEQVVEEPFVSLFAGQLLPQRVTTRLVRALEDGERLGADGTPEVPGRYCIALHPEDLTALRQYHPRLAEELATALQALIGRLQIRLRQPPLVLLQADPTLPPHDIRITPAGDPTLDQTRDLDPGRLEEILAGEEVADGQAYLIIEGKRTFDLTAPTVQIGRALDNDLILEDRRISRRHARLRQRYGRYILQDLGSSGGTTVNGFPVQEVVLRAGDLISLSGVTLIYAEEEPESREATRSPDDTRPQPCVEN